MNIFRQKHLLIGGAIAAVLATGCAKEGSTDTSGFDKTYIESWIKINHPDARRQGLGIYILDETPGAGEAVTNEDYYLFVRYTTTDMNGNITATTEENVAKQLGSFSQSNFYGNDIIINDLYYSPIGVLETMGGMRVGGERTVVIPGWLNVFDDYETAEEYETKSSGTHVIYNVRLVDKVKDITKWELDTLERYVARAMDGVDSTMTGYYCKTLVEPTDTTTFREDTTFYINYTGRLLNGKVFDTTIADTAKVHGIYSGSKTYAPMVVHPNTSDYKEITISSNEFDTGSSGVDGFSYCLSKLRPFEKVVCAFYSTLGYGYSGSSPSIPKFAPLVFEIEVVEAPEEE